MRYCAQILKAVFFLLKRIVRGRRTLKLHTFGFKLKWLFGFGGKHQCAGNDKGSPDILLYNFAIVGELCFFDNYLKIFEI